MDSRKKRILTCSSIADSLSSSKSKTDAKHATNNSDEGECIPSKMVKRGPKTDSDADHAIPDTDTSDTTCFTSVKDKVNLQEIENKKYDSDPSDSGEDEENFNYLQIRNKNMKENEQFIASLGIFKAKEELKNSGKKPSAKKLKKDPVVKVTEVQRRSLRLSKLDPQGNPESKSSTKKKTKTLLTYEYDYDEWIHFSRLCLDRNDILPEGPLDINKDEKSSEFDKLSLTEKRVAKVVKSHLHSLAWHPSADTLLAAAGNSTGCIGIWNVMAEEKNDSNIVTAFKPHVKRVSQIAFSNSTPSKLYTSSYDATLRCLDFEKNVFDEIYSVSATNKDDRFRDFSFVDSNVMVVSRYSGYVSVVDIRTATTSDERSFAAGIKYLQTIHVNPQSANHFITTASAPEACIALWDIRQINTKSPKPLLTLKDHSLSISSAYFSPNGKQIVSCSADDTILLYSVDNATNINLFKRIPHNNYTGRCSLTKFRPTWHPTKENIFVSGSIARPRRIEIFDSFRGSMITSLENEEFLDSVCSLNQFHPCHPTAIVGASSTGLLHVFM